MITFDPLLACPAATNSMCESAKNEYIFVLYICTLHHIFVYCVVYAKHTCVGSHEGITLVHGPCTHKIPILFTHSARILWSRAALLNIKVCNSDFSCS